MRLRTIFLVPLKIFGLIIKRLTNRFVHTVHGHESDCDWGPAKMQWWSTYLLANQEQMLRNPHASIQYQFRVILYGCSRYLVWQRSCRKQPWIFHSPALMRVNIVESNSAWNSKMYLQKRCRLLHDISVVSIFVINDDMLFDLLSSRP